MVTLESFWDAHSVEFGRTQVLAFRIGPRVGGSGRGHEGPRDRRTRARRAQEGGGTGVRDGGPLAGDIFHLMIKRG